MVYDGVLFFPEMVWYMMTTIVGRDFCSQHGSLILFDSTDPINVGLIDVLKWKLRKHISMDNHGELYVQTTTTIPDLISDS